MPDGPTTLMPVLEELLGHASDATSYTNDAKTAALTVAIGAFEGKANAVFFPRDVTETVDSRGENVLAVSNIDVTAVTSVTGPAGETIAANTVTIFDDELRAPVGNRWSPGLHTVTYTCGLTECPDFVARAICLIAQSILANGPWDDRGYSVADEAGVMRLLTAGVAGASFSIPEVQAALDTVRNPWAGP